VFSFEFRLNGGETQSRYFIRFNLRSDYWARVVAIVELLKGTCFWDGRHTWTFAEAAKGLIHVSKPPVNATATYPSIFMPTLGGSTTHKNRRTGAKSAEHRGVVVFSNRLYFTGKKQHEQQHIKIHRTWVIRRSSQDSAIVYLCYSQILSRFSDCIPVLFTDAVQVYCTYEDFLRRIFFSCFATYALSWQQITSFVFELCNAKLSISFNFSMLTFGTHFLSLSKLCLHLNHLLKSQSLLFLAIILAIVFSENCPRKANFSDSLFA
jgi:hypothetical protein